MFVFGKSKKVNPTTHIIEPEKRWAWILTEDYKKFADTVCKCLDDYNSVYMNLPMKFHTGYMRTRSEGIVGTYCIKGYPKDTPEEVMNDYTDDRHYDDCVFSLPLDTIYANCKNFEQRHNKKLNIRHEVVPFIYQNHLQSLEPKYIPEYRQRPVNRRAEDIDPATHEIYEVDDCNMLYL